MKANSAFLVVIVFSASLPGHRYIILPFIEMGRPVRGRLGLWSCSIARRAMLEVLTIILGAITTVSTSLFTWLKVRDEARAKNTEWRIADLQARSDDCDKRAATLQASLDELREAQ